MSINKKEDSINNIRENNKIKLEINYIKNKAINAIEYYSLVELLQNNLKSKNYDKFREIFTILYEENNLEMIDVLFYDIIGINILEIQGDGCNAGIYYQATNIHIVIDIIDKLQISEGEILYDLGSGPGFLGIFAYFYKGIKFKGVEIDEDLVSVGNNIISKFFIEENVQLINKNALDLDYSDLKYLCMFYPFYPKIMIKIIDKLKKTSENHLIKIYDIYGGNFILGEDLVGKGWLDKGKISSTDIIKGIYYSSLQDYKIGNNQEISNEKIYLMLGI